MRFSGLVENEILKIAKQRRFRVVVLILVALIGLIAFTFGPTKEKVESRHRIIVGTKLAFLFDIDHHNRRRYFFVDRSVGIVQGMGDILCTIRSGRLGWKRS